MSKAYKRPTLPELVVDTAYLMSQRTSVQTFEDRLIYFPKGKTESWLRGWIEVEEITGRAGGGRMGAVQARTVIGDRPCNFVVTSRDVNDPWRLDSNSFPFDLAPSNWKELCQADCLRTILSLEKKIEKKHHLADLIKNSRVY